MKPFVRTAGAALLLVLALAWLASRSPVSAQPAAAGDRQEVLGPDRYVFQTRLDHASCEPPSTSGSVTSYVAAIDGIPGSRTMTMHLLNSDHWPDWTLAITPAGQIVGDARQAGVTGPAQGDSHFELARDGNKFTGRGSRSYTATVNGQTRRCRMAFDALLRRLRD